ncbi:molybdate ABC transporter substrate-binding protein [Fictibacillus barbaricus]|uniref:Molybdate transport system substrate-binding protein n=1 Tax=Fictibacillus barbaricus TaxID=182136 RepID=A0ABU1TV15_9BACL|nr:molybdate ABC transporter substrate-binding protein [Fictibacillus barbaricus]MDR7071049.1 molybdate transport system substrate-binding protein [Fictibacillus barbaricus]
MKKSYLLVFSMILLLAAAAGCSKNGSDKENQKDKASSEKKVELTVSAAASLQDVLIETTKKFEKEHPDVKITYNFGASGALQQQISKGAPVDLFFSAAEDKFDQLVQEGSIDKNLGTDLVGNELVLVVPKDSKAGIKGFDDLTKVKKLAIGTPESVPAGDYSKETLKNLKIWKDVEKNIVYAKDVRQVLTYVETGNVDAGIVYKTDALLSSKVKVAETANENTHAPIIYPVGVIKESSHPKEAQQFYKYLQKEETLSTFEKFGFNRVGN